MITAAIGKKILKEVKETKSNKIATKTSKANDKRKRSSDTTSISDIISNQSDSDIIDCIDFEDLMEDCDDNFNFHQEETSLQKSRKDRKCVMKMKNDKNITSEKALADKSTNPLCSKKGKGVGKKSKGKENQIDKNEGISYFATGEEDKNEQIAEYPKETQTCKLQPPGT